MAVLIEDLIKSIETWLRMAKKKQDQPRVDPDLDPVILVAGIAGSILNAVDDEGREERVWVRIIGADHEFRTKLWSKFDSSTGKTVSMDEKMRITVPEDRYGLYAIDTLDPDMIIGRESVFYYRDLIVQMIRWGFQEGKTLFGFGYDFRQSNRLQETMDKFSAKLESAYTSSGGRKINVITHSMGGLLVKCFMSLHSDIFEKYVKNWIAIAAPFQGAPGYVTTALLNGCSFVHGWEQNFFISKWSMQQLVEVDGKQIHLPFNLEILKWANETREILSRAKVPATVKFYNIYGTHYDTPHSVCYGSEQEPISDAGQLLSTVPKFICVNGDGTVPAESAMADELDAVARVGVPSDHRGIICDHHVFRILKQWIKAGEPDPFYNPLNDYVVLPTAFEIEKYCEQQGFHVTNHTDDWEMVSPNTDTNNDESALSVHSPSEGMHLVEVRAVGVTASG